MSVQFPSYSKGTSSNGCFSSFPRENQELKHVGLLGTRPKEGALVPKKFLTSAKMDERRAKGLCFYYDEPFTPGHQLKHKRPQLYTMELDDDSMGESENEDDCSDGEEEQVQISVNAVAGVSDFKTMRVKGMHGTKSIYVLIDSGSTHNFIDGKMAQKLGCLLSPAGSTKVTVADGSTLAVSAKVESFEWSFHQVSFKTDLMVIPLGCCDMVLGIQWLETLGPVTWDFKNLLMEFRLDGKKVKLKGMRQGSVREVRSNKIKGFNGQHLQMAMLCVSDTTEKGHATLCNIQGGVGSVDSGWETS